VDEDDGSDKDDGDVVVDEEDDVDEDNDGDDCAVNDGRSSSSTNLSLIPSLLINSRASLSGTSLLFLEA